MGGIKGWVLKGELRFWGRRRSFAGRKGAFGGRGGRVVMNYLVLN